MDETIKNQAIMGERNVKDKAKLFENPEICMKSDEKKPSSRIPIPEGGKPFYPNEELASPGSETKTTAVGTKIPMNLTIQPSEISPIPDSKDIAQTVPKKKNERGSGKGIVKGNKPAARPSTDSAILALIAKLDE